MMALSGRSIGSSSLLGTINHHGYVYRAAFLGKGSTQAVMLCVSGLWPTRSFKDLLTLLLYIKNVCLLVTGSVEKQCCLLSAHTGSNNLHVYMLHGTINIYTCFPFMHIP